MGNLTNAELSVQIVACWKYLMRFGYDVFRDEEIEITACDNINN